MSTTSTTTTSTSITNLRSLTDDSQFAAELANAGAKLVVADFTANWCGPCQRIAPLFANLAKRFPQAIFLKIDVDQCPETAMAQNVSAMPTFIFYRNKVKIERLQGADPQALERKVQEHYGAEEGDEAEGGLSGHLDLNSFINKTECECLNEADDHPLAHCLTSNGGYLESDCDEQLIISFGFNQSVKIHSIKVKAPNTNGPKTLKLFINQPNTIDFDKADSMSPVQQIELSPTDLDGNALSLRFVKFQNVQNLQIFVKDNQSGAETTRIDSLVLVGSPVTTTNMTDFKRVAGKKGESH